MQAMAESPRGRQDRSREYGLLNHDAADAVKVFSVGKYTPDARRFARGKPIELVTGAALLNLVRKVQNAQKRYAADAPGPVPTLANTMECANCGAEMLKRENRSTKQAFWGYPNYPRCRGTRPVQGSGFNYLPPSPFSA